MNAEKFVLAVMGIAFAVFLAALTIDAMANTGRPETTDRQVAVLMCSHRWSPDGTIVHENAHDYAACMDAFEQAGVVP